MSDQGKPHMHEDDTDMHPISKAVFGWVTHKWTARIFLWGLAVLSIVLISIDLIHHRHVEQDIESISGFYGIYGFIAFGFVVLMGRPLGWLLRRDENYYGDADDIDGGQP